MTKKILVVDDASAIRQIVSLSLSQAGYSVDEAVNGVDALDKIQLGEYKLIISDVNMPEMNGIELLRNIKEDDKYSNFRFLPFIMLTTEAGKNRVEEGKKLGARAWIVKPFKPEELLEAVKKMIG